MTKIVGFLQNAWSPIYAGGVWPRDSWLKALHKSRSGQRLKHLTDKITIPYEMWYDNTTPIVGDNPNSIIEPDFNHIIKVLDVQKPNIVITFGKQAERCLTRLWSCEDYLLIVCPHPAYRLVKNELFYEAARLISCSPFYTGNWKWKLEQTKNGIEVGV